MDFDGGKRKEFMNWNFAEKDLKNLRTLTAVLTPVITLCFLFSVNVVKVENTSKRLPALHSQLNIKNLVEDDSQTWYAQISKEKGNTVAKR